MTPLSRRLSPWGALLALALASTTFGGASPALGVEGPTSDTTGQITAQVTCVDGMSNIAESYEWTRGAASATTTVVGLFYDGALFHSANAFPSSTGTWGAEGFEGPESGSLSISMYTWVGTFPGFSNAALVTKKIVTWDCSGPFFDVPASRAFAKEIDWLAGSGITSGFSDGTFRPLESVNRDAMAAFLYRFAGKPAFSPPAVSPFTDLSPSTPFYKEITWLASTGITGGFSDGTFRPQETVNRDAMAAFLYRFAGRPDFTPPTTSPFSDITPSTPFYTEITWLASTNITGGFSDSTFRSLQSVKRDAMAAFLYRFDEKGLAAL